MADYRNVLLALGWYYPEIHRGVAEFAKENRWHLTIDFDDLVPKNWAGDGVLTLLGAKEGIWNRLKNFQGPIVDLADSRSEITLPRVIADNRQIGELAADHFLEKGFRNFAFFHRWDLGTSLQRRDAFIDLLQLKGHSCSVACWQKERGDREDDRMNRHDWLVKHVKDLPKPVGIFCPRDIEAAEVVDACLAEGVAVPKEVAILGADNSETVCQCLQTPLSSIRTNLEEVGFEGARLLDRLMNRKGKASLSAASDERILIQPKGIAVRSSTDFWVVDHPKVAAAIRFIHNNFYRPIGMPDILEVVGGSRSGLEKAFRENFQRPPVAELRRVRIESAKKLLAETEQSVADVAIHSGFQNSHHLCRVFRKQIGMTPLSFREENQQERKVK